jgi:hypothetical protein
MKGGMHWLSKEKRRLGRVRGRRKPRVAEGSDAGRMLDGRIVGSQGSIMERWREAESTEVPRLGEGAEIAGLMSKVELTD